MPLFITRNDITKMKVDAIVNAANSSLLGGGGVDGAIHRAAGPELLDECKTLHGCKPGEAKVTKAYRLDAKYIIHTVGPIYMGGNENEANILASCYLNCLELAKKLECNSIAFPQISTGVYGYPKEEAFRISKLAIDYFLTKNEMDVYIVIYGSSSIDVSNRLEKDIQYYLDHRLIDDNKKVIAYCCQKELDVLDKEDDTCCSIIESNCLIKEPLLKVDDKNVQTKKNYKRRNIQSFDYLCCVPPFEPKPNDGFAMTLIDMINEKGLTDVEAYKRSNINRKLFSKINNNINYKPTKNTILSFCIGLGLNLEQSNKLLASAGFILSNSLVKDLIITYFIENKIYDIYQVNEVLFKYDQELLGQKCD